MNVDTRLYVGLWFLVASGVMVGAWAQFFPQAFYDSFPGLGRSWVSVDGPFNEHLVRDVGGLYLALSAVTLIAVFAKTRETILAASLGWLVSQIPHFAYHMTHLHVYTSMLDKVGNVLTLGLLVLVPAYVFVRAVRHKPQYRI